MYNVYYIYNRFAFNMELWTSKGRARNKGVLVNVSELPHIDSRTLE